MAEVFLARAEGPMGFEKTLVLKRILPHLAEDPAFVGMFFTEARVAAQLNHPHIVQIFDFGQADGTYYLAMEYIDGPDLRTLSARAVQAGVALPPALCAKIISAACEGLAFAHDFVDPTSGKHLELIHRDISPDNILLSRQGTVKVVDFGIAKASNQSHKTKTGLIKGKIAYMPVEQLQGQQLDRRADVYALGLVLYELLTGKYPFEATTDVSMMQAILFEPLVPASTRRPDLPQAVVSILEKALAKVREQRYPDCVSFQADLERFILSTGQTVGGRDMAQWVERLCPKGTGAARLNPSDREDIGFNATLMSPKQTPSSVAQRATMAVPLDASSAPEGAAPNTPRARTALSHPTAQDTEPPLEPTLISPSQLGLPAVQPEKTAAPEKTAVPTKKDTARRAGLAVVVGGLVLAAAGSGVVVFRDTSTPPVPAPQVPPAPLVQAMPTPPATPQPVVANPAAPATPAQPEPPTEASEPVAVSAPEPTEVQPVRRKSTKAKLEFRIRPYATVFLDGKALGQTPFPAVQVPIGMHTVRLINRDLGKDVTRDFEVKAGQPNIFKHDLEKR
ncbi:serine/threonine-protein kinase [Archangium gephyra]